ncbi:transcription factor TFIIIB component B'' homolog [Cololabis saira]|uniref:transcription factor TFIIIB component B'' homolog n=1 Tax=Cololabis saira TaxID=129043 RepID=UPI002AD2A1BD|nr:transcription factor TFIIIB component B'' homolog [Cololabis saira]
MFRRSRFSARPNVSTLGRTASAASQETPAANQEAGETIKEAGENVSAAAAATNKTDVTPISSGDGNEQNVEGASSSAAVQRRKRFSVKPKVAPGRLPALSRTPKSPIKAASVARVDSHGSDFNQPSTSSQSGAAAAPQGLQSPRRRRQSEDGNQLKMPPKTSETSGPTAEESPDQSRLSPDSSKMSENSSGVQRKESPFKVPPSLPDKEATEISEKAKTLVSSKHVSSLKSSALSLTRLLNSPSDLQRLAKAQKLRELLKQEQSKEKRQKRAKSRPKEFTLDPAKMTMRDLIYYLPTSNPMLSSLDEDQENETEVPPSPGREESPEQAKEPKILPNKAVSGEEEEAAVVDEEEEEDDAIMVPQVRVAEDGTLIIDEESLTVEVKRAKGPNPAEGRDPIFERGSTTTYSSFRKGTYTKPWSAEETDMFFLAISMVGTDFSMICQLFPHRARSEIKNKFKREERENSWRIDKAFKDRRKLDIDCFSKLLEKVLEVQKDRKKLKSLVEKNTPKKSKTKAKGKKSANKLSDIEEEEDENKVLELEEGGEKENDDQSVEGGVPAPEPKKKCKRKTKASVLNEEPTNKKNKTDEAGVPEDSEAALPEDQTNDTSDKTENVPTIKPAKLCRSRAPKPLVPLGLKRGKKPPPTLKDKETPSDKDGENARGEVSNEQENNDESQASQSNKKMSDDTSEEEEEDTPVKPQKPTRYGRVPKPTQPLNYPPEEEPQPSDSETSLQKSKPKSSLKRGKASKQQPAEKSKKAKLITLRSSRSEFSDEDNDNQEETGEQASCSSSSSNAPLFVPDSLHAANAEITEVDENMVELEILASMPDVLGISQDALCPDSSCHQAQHETGTAEPCEHQLDLLVDVIDFLSSEHAEVSHDESYTEAAQALLTIGNMPHVTQSAQSELSLQDYTTGATWDGGNGPSQTEEETLPHSVSADFSQRLTETSANASAEELQGSGADGWDTSHTRTSEQTLVELQTVCMDPTPPVQPDPNVPPTKAGRSSKVKPKPHLGRTSRAVQPVSHAEISPGESHLAAPPSDTPSAAEETAPEISQSAALLEDPLLLTEVKVTEEPSDNKKLEVESGAPSSDQSSCSFSEPQSEPSREQVTTDATSTEESHVGSAETGFNKPATSDPATTGAEQESCRDAAPVQETGDKPPAEDLTPSQKGGGEVAGPSQSRRSRLPKVKPKPNLPQTSRAAKYKPQATEDAVDQDSAPTPTAKVDPEPTCSPSPTSTPAEEPPANEEIKMHAGLAVLDAPSSDQSATGNQNITEPQCEPSREQVTTDAKSTEESHVGSAETAFNKPVTSDPTTTGAEQESCREAAPVQETGDKPPAEDLTPSQKGGGEVAGPSQSRRSRLPKVKPKPNLPQTSRAAKSKPQATEAAVDQDSAPTPTQPTCSPSPTSTPAEEPPAKEEIKMHAGLAVLDAPSSDQSVTGNQNISEPQSEPSKEQVTTDATSTEESHVGSAETGFNKPATSDPATTGAEQESCRDAAPVQETGDKPPAEDLTPSQKGGGEVAGPSQSRRSRLPKVKPNLRLTSRAAKSKPQATEDAVDQDSAPTPTAKVDPQPTCSPSPTSTPAEKPPANEEIKMHAGLFDPAVLDAPSSDQSVTGNQNISEPQSEPSKEQVTRETGSISGFTEENLASHGGAPESGCRNAALTDVAVTEPPDGKGSTVYSGGTADPAETTAPEEESMVGQQEREAATASLLQPSLAQTLRAARPKPQTAEKSIEKDSNPEFIINTIADAELTCTPSVINPASVNSEEKKTYAGPVDQTETVANTSGQSATESLTVSEVQTEPSGEPAATEPSTGTESQSGQGSNSTSVQDESGHLGAFDTSAGESSVSRGETEDTSQCQRRRSRLQRPKPNLQQAPKTSGLQPQAKNEPAEKDLSASPTPQFRKTISEVEPQDASLPEKHSGSTDVGPVSKEDLGGLRSDPVASEDQSISGVQLEPSTEQVTDENLAHRAGAAESSLNNVTSADTAATEPQGGLSPNVNSASVQKQSEKPSTSDTSVGKSSVSTEEAQVASASQTRRSRFPKPKPNLPQTSRAARLRPQTPKGTVSPSPKAELTKTTTAEVQPQLPGTSLPRVAGKNTPGGLLQAVDESQSSSPRPEPSDDDTLAEAEARSTQAKSAVSETPVESASAQKCTEEPSSAEELLRTNAANVTSLEAAEQHEAPR